MLDIGRKVIDSKDFSCRVNTMDIKQIKNLLDIFEGTVERRCAIYEIADDEDDENRAAAECGAAKAELIRAIEQLVQHQAGSST